jgi:hypothetical protein
MHPFDAWTARNALGKIFWGTLICVLDFHFSQTSNGSGFKFDVINDVVGTVMIAWGLGQLAPLVADSTYVGIMRFCGAVAAMAVIDALLDHIVTPWPPPVRVIWVAFSLLCLASIYRFCFAMRLFCGSVALLREEESWQSSQGLFLWLNVVPALILHAVSLPWLLSHGQRRLEIGPIAIVIVIVGFIPLVHILLSISRTRKALEEPGELAKFM